MLEYLLHNVGRTNLTGVKNVRGVEGLHSILLQSGDDSYVRLMVYVTPEQPPVQAGRLQPYRTHPLALSSNVQYNDAYMRSQFDLNETALIDPYRMSYSSPMFMPYTTTSMDTRVVPLSPYLHVDVASCEDVPATQNGPYTFYATSSRSDVWEPVATKKLSVTVADGGATVQLSGDKYYTLHAAAPRSIPQNQVAAWLEFTRGEPTSHNDFLQISYNPSLPGTSVQVGQYIEGAECQAIVSAAVLCLTRTNELNEESIGNKVREARAVDALARARRAVAGPVNTARYDTDSATRMSIRDAVNYKDAANAAAFDALGRLTPDMWESWVAYLNHPRRVRLSPGEFAAWALSTAALVRNPAIRSSRQRTNPFVEAARQAINTQNLQGSEVMTWTEEVSASEDQGEF